MTVVRALARPLLSAIFVVQGAKALRDPEPHVAKAQPVADRFVPLIQRVAPPQVGERIPESTANLVRLNGAAQVLGGLALASGKGRRLGAVLLASSLVPTTLAGHSFWQETDKSAKAAQKIQFLKNLGIMGGLLLAAVDTEGKPGVAWRTTHGAKAVKRETKRSAKLAKRETKQFARTAKREARLAAHAAKAELPFR
ncbi:DoxX family protein [Kribbella sp. CA-293567]|uniref:DoxX family protein n=1 Tax=Kribbella sp. CA-293567 TaxID=3002436 RepID=UPI0022DE774B|nr:DoxX family protein [Kribbella sp. CA-293567]WBQ07194.1 DoxX family protein [Kribbella sp. CA-293567]